MDEGCFFEIAIAALESLEEIPKVGNWLNKPGKKWRKEIFHYLCFVFGLLLGGIAAFLFTLIVFIIVLLVLFIVVCIVVWLFSCIGIRFTEDPVSFIFNLFGNMVD